MFLSHRYNPFEELDRTFNSFWEDDSDEYNDFFSTIKVPRTKRISKEEKLKKKLNKLHNQENEINHYIKQYESHIEQLKKNKQSVEKKRSDLSNKINQIAEEKKKQLEAGQNQQSANNDNQKQETRVFKKVHYISDGMEIEEQYDSTNPKNCYKIIRKQGEAPQIISGEKKAQIEQSQTEEQQKQKKQKLGNGLDEKLEQLCKMSGKPASELENFVIENKDLTVGQLYDKAIELKLL